MLCWSEAFICLDLMSLWLVLFMYNLTCLVTKDGYFSFNLNNCQQNKLTLYVSPNLDIYLLHSSILVLGYFYYFSFMIQESTFEII